MQLQEGRKSMIKESLSLTQHDLEETPTLVTTNCVARTSPLTPYPEMWAFHHKEFKFPSWKKEEGGKKVFF